MSRTLPILILLALAAPGSGRAGTISIAPANSAITLGQTATFTISVDSDFANNPVGDEIGAMRLFVDASGPAPFTIGNFRIDLALPAGSTFLRTDPSSGSVDIQVAHTPSSPLSFIGPVYEFDFTPSVAGIYDFSLTSSPSIVAYVQTVDTLDATNFGSLLVRPVPETRRTYSGRSLPHRVGAPAAEVTPSRVRRRSGRDSFVFGSANLSKTLVERDLFNDYRRAPRVEFKPWRPAG